MDGPTDGRTKPPIESSPLLKGEGDKIRRANSCAVALRASDTNREREVVNQD